MENYTNACTSTQNSMMSQFRTGSGHWRCSSCMESVVYVRTPNGVNYTRLWQCCNCGYALNGYALDAGCSYCDSGSNAIGTYGESWTAQEAFDLSLRLEPPVNDPDTVSHIVCQNESFDPCVMQRDDLASTVQQNVSCFHDFLANSDPTATFDYDEYFGYTSGATAIPCHDYNLASSVIGPTHPQCENSPSKEITQCQDASTLFAECIRNDTNESSTCSTYPLESNSECLDNLDSGYGSLLNSFTTTSECPENGKRKFDSEPLHDSAASNVSQSKRGRQQIGSNEPRVACPFYKHDPTRCKHNACAGLGYDAIGRLLEHIKRDHRYFQCERCGIAYRGRGGEEALERHRQERNCALQTRCVLWGLDQLTWGKIKSRKGILNKTTEERWRDIYRVLFPSVNEDAMPSPYVSRSTSISTAPTYYYDAEHRQRQAAENLSREILCLLPDRIASNIQSTINDDRLLAVWNAFASNQLNDVLRGILHEITSVPDLIERRSAV